MQAYLPRREVPCRSILDMPAAQSRSTKQRHREIHVLLHVGILYDSDRAMQRDGHLLECAYAIISVENIHCP